MNAHQARQDILEDIRINIELAALWATLMSLYIYVDYFHLLMPGSIKDILSGKVFVFDITPTFLLVGLASVTVPALMIFLSVALPAKANRRTNIAVATIYIPFTIFNLAGEAWAHMVFAAVVEVILLLLVVRNAWTWSRKEKSQSTAGSPG